MASTLAMPSMFHEVEQVDHPHQVQRAQHGAGVGQVKHHAEQGDGRDGAHPPQYPDRGRQVAEEAPACGQAAAVVYKTQHCDHRAAAQRGDHQPLLDQALQAHHEDDGEAGQDDAHSAAARRGHGVGAAPIWHVQEIGMQGIATGN